MMNLKQIIEKMDQGEIPEFEELCFLMELPENESLQILFPAAYETRKRCLGNGVALRGIVEFSNYCTKNCYYCGIRRGNANVQRYSMTEEEMQPYLEIAYRDVAAAFEYYFEHCNNGRPIILAGFSQGSQLLLMLMKEYFDDPKYSEKLIAAYCIGWRITEEEVAQYPQLKMAQGEDDTGVIVSFNSEAEGVEESLIVPNGGKTLGINPLNWKTDSTPADKSLNKGACFTRYSGEIKKEISQLTGAYLDEERGTLRVTDVAPSDYSNSLFPEGVYHLYDYQFFFRNLQENVAVRLERFLQKKQ